MENNDDTSKKSNWGVPAILFFVFVVILIPMIRKGIDTNEIQGSESNYATRAPSVLDREKIDSAMVSGSDSTKYIFSFNKATIMKMEGSKIITSQDSILTGYIVIKKDKLRIGPVTSPEDYVIKGYKKATNGGYVFETKSESDENCNITILKNGDKDLVVLHYTELQVMIYLYINQGFTLNLVLFSDKQ